MRRGVVWWGEAVVWCGEDIQVGGLLVNAFHMCRMVWVCGGYDASTKTNLSPHSNLPTSELISNQ